jgi:hypothetical protein
MPEIAKTDQVVRDQRIGIDRQVLAGQPVPPELLDAYHEAGGETTEATPPRRARADQRQRRVASSPAATSSSTTTRSASTGRSSRVPRPAGSPRRVRERDRRVGPHARLRGTSDEELTGEDLANRAAELKIKGRSSMTADELRDAVAKAEADQA